MRPDARGLQRGGERTSHDDSNDGLGHCGDDRRFEQRREHVRRCRPDYFVGRGRPNHSRILFLRGDHVGCAQPHRRPGYSYGAAAHRDGVGADRDAGPV